MLVFLTLFLCGDVMTGRGIDAAFPTSVAPTLHEPVIRDAREYLKLARERRGPIPLPVTPEYIWGDALAVLERYQPAARIINLETAVTTSPAWDRDKGIHYRMHPANVACLAAADIDVAVLANNHVLDWGRPGLTQTLATLADAGIATAGAGRDDDVAATPAALDRPTGDRILVFAFAHPTSGVPRDWAATAQASGVNFLPRLGPQAVAHVKGVIEAVRQPGDLIVFSVHWGANWGYEISADQIRFARALVDAAGVDVIHGHSSHHPIGFEIYRGRPIFYGCGDFINDYEGITGHEAYRPDLSLMYFPTFDEQTGRLQKLELVPMQIRNLQVNRAPPSDAQWLRDRLNRACRPFELAVKLDEHGVLRVPIPGPAADGKPATRNPKTPDQDPR